MSSFIDLNDRVLVNNLSFEYLSRYQNTYGTVVQLCLSFVPASAIVRMYDGKELGIYLKDLESVPPEDCIFQRNEQVRITKDYDKSAYHICKSRLIGKIGTVKNWDKRDSTILVDCGFEGCGWFPVTCLLPCSYQGEHFFYPNDRVKHENELFTVQTVKVTKFGNGQLLKLNGQWVPSSECEPIK